MANQKIKKQVSISKNKSFNKKNSVNKLKQKSKDYSGFFIPFIIIITAIVFANTLGNDFVDNWDDRDYILNNDIIKMLNWKALREIFSSYYVGCYHPITMLSYMIEYRLFGLNPFFYHFTNYIFHILNVILVYLFIKRFTGKPWVAMITSLFFAVHPMHVESVAWISERKDVLYTFFFLLSLNSYSKYLLSEKKINLLIWSFVWFFLSLLSKPSAVCLPLVFVLLDYYHNKNFSWKILISKIPFFLLALFFGIIAVFAQKSSGAIFNITPLFNFIDRVFLVSYSAFYYLFKVFFPFNLSALHYYPIKSGGFLPFEYYLSLPALLLLIWCIYKSHNFKHELIFGLLFYLSTIILVLQGLQVGRAIVSERYSYVPYIGIFFIFGQFFSYIKDNKFSFGNKIKSVSSIVIIILAILFSYLTFERNKIWKNGIVLFTDVINKHPEQDYGWLARGNSLKEKGDINNALADYNKAIELNPESIDAFLNRGAAYEKNEKYFNALADFNNAIKLKPDYPEALNNRGTVYNEINKFDSAIADYNIAIKLKPDYTDAFYNRGIAYQKISKYDYAINDFNKAINLNPNYTEAYHNRGNIYSIIGKYDLALADYNITIKLKPDYADAYNNRGTSYMNLGNIDESLRNFNKAIELNPKYSDAYFNRGITKFKLNDKTGACNDLLMAQKNGNPQAAAALEMYCK